MILDFSADWCLPCHELERKTFTDARVIAAAGEFATFKVDLTHADSPAAVEHTKRFRIQGVPTIVFLAPGGREVEAARFSGFLPAEAFLEKLKLASAAASGGAQSKRLRVRDESLAKLIGQRSQHDHRPT